MLFSLVEFFTRSSPMLNIKKSTISSGFNKVITNAEKNYWQYYTTSTIITFLLIAIIDILIYQDFVFQIKEKEKSYLQGTEIAIKNLILHDLKLVYDGVLDSSKLTILKNYSPVNAQKRNTLIEGNVLYINWEHEQIIFDLQPLVYLLSSILTDNFHYQITLHGKLLMANIEDFQFFSTRTYQINKENDITVKLGIKQDSSFAQANLTHLNIQTFGLLIISVLGFLMAMPLIIYFIHKIEKFYELTKKISILQKEHEVYLGYAKAFKDLDQHSALSDEFLVIKPTIDHLDVNEFLEEIKILVLAYNIRVFYKFELHLISDVSSIDIACNSALFKQIIISLLLNILYFMRGGTHIKNFSINFHKGKILIIYDSFAASEKHMCQWSEDLSHHIYNPYILNCKRIFQLIKQCGLSYEVVPQQGNNKIIIFNLTKKEEFNRVIKFNKKY